jgi:hypothetical protein
VARLSGLTADAKGAISTCTVAGTDLQKRKVRLARRLRAETMVTLECMGREDIDASALLAGTEEKRIKRNV